MQHPTRWENTSWKRVTSVCLANLDRGESYPSLHNLSINTRFFRTEVTCSVVSFIFCFSEFHFLLTLLSSPFQRLDIFATWQYRSNEQNWSLQNWSLQNWPTTITREKANFTSLLRSPRCKDGTDARLEAWEHHTTRTAL